MQQISVTHLFDKLHKTSLTIGLMNNVGASGPQAEASTQHHGKVLKEPINKKKIKISQSLGDLSGITLLLIYLGIHCANL